MFSDTAYRFDKTNINASPVYRYCSTAIFMFLFFHFSNFKKIYLSLLTLYFLIVSFKLLIINIKRISLSRRFRCHRELISALLSLTLFRPGGRELD